MGLFSRSPQLSPVPVPSAPPAPQHAPGAAPPSDEFMRRLVADIQSYLDVMRKDMAMLKERIDGLSSAQERLLKESVQGFSDVAADIATIYSRIDESHAPVKPVEKPRPLYRKPAPAAQRAVEPVDGGAENGVDDFEEEVRRMRTGRRKT